MRKRIRGLITGVIVGTMLTSGVVFAKQVSETINVVYDNIKILIDGKEYKPTDATGNLVEPFIYNGTTYLPVRAIANAFDKEVDWEAQTSTVTLGSKNYDWLDQMGYVDYETTGSRNVFSAISAKTIMSDGLKFDRGMEFRLDDDTYESRGTIEHNDGTMECYHRISYLLNNQYNSFEGVITARDSQRSAQIKFYGDGQLIYSSPVISQGMKSTNFKIDVSNIKLLKISIDYINPSDSNFYVSACIADARLSKK